MQPIDALCTYNTPKLATADHLRRLVIGHIDYLRRHKTTRRMAIDQSSARPFYNNLYSYLTDQRISKKIHWIILIINKIDSPENFDETVDHLLIPDESIVEQIEAMYPS